MLLLKRISPFEFWQSVTGSLDTGESPIDAAKRELFEETGLGDEDVLVDARQSRSFTIDPRWRDRYARGVSENIEHEFRYRLPAPTDIRISPAEHSAYQWFPLEAAIAAVWSWTNKQALEALRPELE